METMSKKLTQEEIDNFGKEIEELRTEIQKKVGEEDADYIKNVYAKMRYNEIIGRLIIHYVRN
jgi:NADPH-dependent stearoyl-CoA 9-desaturase